MLLYRGTPKPESIPKLRAFDAIFFTFSKNEALDYATGGEQENGYVQEYFSPDNLNLLDLDEPDGKAVVEDFFGKKMREQDFIDLAHYPKTDWLEHVRNMGFDGVVRHYIVLFGVSDVRLLKRWKLTYNEGRLRYDWKLVHEAAQGIFSAYDRVTEGNIGEMMESTCGTTAKWVIAPFGDPNELTLSCDAHLVSFLEDAVDPKDGLGAEEVHVYPISPEKRGAGCSHEIAVVAPKS